MIRTPNLISYLPNILQSVKEFQVINDAENPEFQVVFDTSEQVLNNLFIETGDLEGIKRYEKILKIKSLKNDTLETRIFRVLLKWNDRIPYTWRILLEKLDILCGKNNYTISLENNAYTLKFETHLNIYGSVDELNILLEKIIPCNLIFIINNILYGKSEGSLYFGSTITSGSHYILSSNFKSEYLLSASSFIGSALIISSHIELS